MWRCSGGGRGRHKGGRRGERGWVGGIIVEGYSLSIKKLYLCNSYSAVESKGVIEIILIVFSLAKCKVPKITSNERRINGLWLHNGLVHTFGRDYTIGRWAMQNTNQKIKPVSSHTFILSAFIGELGSIEEK